MVWRFAPHAIVFCSASCIMVVELVAGRLMARHVGSSLYTWTSIIGVVLAGMSVGNLIGGKMADRWKPEAVLGWLFLSSSLACVLTLLINSLFAATRPLKGLDWPVQIFFSALVIFALPAAVLGTISPAAAKMAVNRSRTVGATLGSFYGVATAGSILGTFATGFWLIEAFGSRGVVLFISLGLALVGLCLGPRRVVHAVWVAVIAAALAYSQTSSCRPQGGGYRPQTEGPTIQAKERGPQAHGRDARATTGATQQAANSR
ncbi:MAG: fused MFS/spermidine synthase [Planctomycetota bacterium]|nr:fused MFS/spermidine synthase [Planctomycetota bacterium]